MILTKYNKLNITFCGMMGSGKSIIGSKFAKIIKFDFIDTDALIEEKLENQLMKFLINLVKCISESLKKSISVKFFLKKIMLFH